MAVSGAYTYVPSGSDCSITDYDASIGGYSPNIPSSLDGYTVTTLGTSSFSGKSLTGVTIPSTVTLIGGSAFQSNSISSLTIPSSVTTIQASAFKDNSITGNLTIPSSVTSLGTNCFQNNNLTSLTIPSSITAIPAYCFQNNANLSSVNIQGNVTGNFSSGSAPFSGCSLGDGLTLSASQTSIGNYMFYNAGLTSVVLPSSIGAIGTYSFQSNPNLARVDSRGNITGNFSSSSAPFSGCALGDNLSLSASQTSIGNYMFYNAGITSAYIPNSVTLIGTSSFANNTNLAKFYVANNSVTFSTGILTGNMSAGNKGTVYGGDPSNTKTWWTNNWTGTYNFSSTVPTVPSVSTTDPVTIINSSSVTAEGNVTSDGGGTVVERGFAYATTNTPTILDSKVTVSAATGSYTATISGLSVSVTYYTRAFARNFVGVGYGDNVDFTTAVPPTVVSTSFTPVSTNSANAVGNVTSDGYATITERGFVYATTATPTILDSKVTVSGTVGSFSKEITGLNPGTTYYLRAFATNDAGTGYGSQLTTNIQYQATTTVTPLIQILDYIDTLTATASTTSATILFATTAGLSIDDFIVNATRNNTSRRVDDIPTAGVHDLNATIPNQAQDDEIRTYKFTDHSDLIKQETLTFTERIQGGGDLAFQMVTDGTYIPRAGQYIRLYLNNTLYFTGMINTIIRRLPQDGITTKIFFDVTATQLKIVPPRRTITLNYDIDTTCSTIVNDVINNYLVDEGFMAGTVNAGVKLSEQWLDDCISIGDILDQCANLSGFQWYVDENFDLQFMQDPTTISTCTYVISDLTNSFTDFRNVTVEETIDNYTNKVFIAGGNDQNGNLVIVGQQTTASILEMQNYSAGSGVWGRVERNSSETKAEYEVAEAGTSETTIVLGTATMASITLTVGDEIRNDTRDVRSTVASITVTSFDVLTAITGQTAGDDIVIYSNSNQVARNILKRQDQIPKRISFDTFTLGFRAGQELQVALSSLSMSTTASYIVEEVNISHIADKYFRSTIRAILRNADNLSTQKNPDSWDFFKQIGASASKRAGYGPQRGAVNPKVTVSTTTPSNPKVNDIFMRTSPTPSVQFWYNGSSWVE